MSYSLNIEKTNNGYILSWEEDWSDEETNISDIRHEKEVIENECPPENHPYYKEDGLGEMDEEQYTMKKLLERVAEYFGCSYDKFSKTNLKVTFNKKGHKTY